MGRFAPAVPGVANIAAMAATSRNNRLLMDEWLAWLRDVKRLQPSTILDYGKRARVWLAWCGASRLQDVEAIDIERWAARPKRDGRPTLPATVRKNLASVSSLYAWLRSSGYMDTNPVDLAASPRVRNTNPRPIHKTDFIRLWSWCSRNDREALVMVGLGTFGLLRRAEIASLTPSHYDQDTQELRHFIRKGGGTDVTPVGLMFRIFAEHQPDMLPNIEVLVASLGKIKSVNQPAPRLLFNVGSPWALPGGDRLTTINSSMTKWCRAAGIPHYTPHQMRHTGITWMMRSRVPPMIVRDLADHKSLNTTMRYTKIGGSQDLRDWLDG